MLLAGDEMGRTQGGNNNAYCQDNEVSWVDWTGAARYQDLLDFTRALAGCGASTRCSGAAGSSAGCRRRLRPATTDLQDIIWLAPSGREMTDADWQAGYARALARVPERRRDLRARAAR